MADHAIARPCPNCATLVTYAGAYGDEALSGQCGCCKQSLTVPNPLYTAPAQGAVPSAIAAASAKLTPESQAALLAELEAKVAEPVLVADPEVLPDDPPAAEEPETPRVLAYPEAEERLDA